MKKKRSNVIWKEIPEEAEKAISWIKDNAAYRGDTIKTSTKACLVALISYKSHVDRIEELEKELTRAHELLHAIQESANYINVHQQRIGDKCQEAKVFQEDSKNFNQHRYYDY